MFFLPFPIAAIFLLGLFAEGFAWKKEQNSMESDGQTREFMDLINFILPMAPEGQRRPDENSEESDAQTGKIREETMDVRRKRNAISKIHKL
uniref:Uncharacterized protein n=1 Tax=Globodera rostochiensis TaxID=31243 RepID=A0A914HZG0_GLORO